MLDMARMTFVLPSMFPLAGRLIRNVRPTPLAMNLDRLYNESLALLEGRGIRKDEQRAFEVNRTAATEGHADAILAMGWFYVNGVGVDRSITDAITWYRRSARRGEPRAMFSLGFIAYEQKDWDDAMTWLRRAAEAGHHRSLFWIGKLHWKGCTATQSRSEAMRLIHLATKKKVPDATRALRWLAALNKAAKSRLNGSQT
jgi:TPR repeat protein